MKLSPTEKIDLIRARVHRLFKELEDINDVSHAYEALATTKKELLRLAEICDYPK
jgi:hypothetical protein